MFQHNSFPKKIKIRSINDLKSRSLSMYKELKIIKNRLKNVFN